MESTAEGRTGITAPLDELHRSRRGRYLLVLLDGEVLAHPLPASGAVTVGRSSSADVCIEHPSISRRHLRLSLDDPPRVEDLDSSNGTRLNDKPISRGQPVVVTPGDRIGAGSAVITLQWLGPITAAAPDEERPVMASPAMVEIDRLLDRIAPSPLSIVLRGETGVGKEVIADEVHRRSQRSDRLILKLNCAALPGELLESELFGYERGAFTGATERRAGLLERASGGTLFLDEVGDMPPAVQVRLLRALENGEIMPVGAREPVTIDIRVIAATHRELDSASFREDLYYRLNGFTLEIPPLRDRPEDIPELARRFVGRMAARLGRAPPSLSGEAIEALLSHPWPGNVRELRNVAERATVLVATTAIGVDDLMFDEASTPPTSEAAAIRDALEQCGGNQTRAAELLGISRSTLVRRLDHYGLSRPKKR